MHRGCESEVDGAASFRSLHRAAYDVQRVAVVSLYVEVDDVPAHVARASERGAKVVIPAQKAPDGDQMAVIRDTEGIPFGLMRRAR